MELCKKNKSDSNYCIKSKNSFVQVTANSPHLTRLPDIFQLDKQNKSAKFVPSDDISQFLKIHSIPRCKKKKLKIDSHVGNSPENDQRNGKCHSAFKRINDVSGGRKIIKKNEAISNGGNRGKRKFSDTDKMDMCLSECAESNEELQTKGNGNRNIEVMSDNPSTLKDMSIGNTELSCSKFMKFYKVLNTKKYILHLQHSTGITLHGKIKATLICGELDIFGFVLNTTSARKTVEIFSPRRCMYITVTSKIPSLPTGRMEIEKYIQCEIHLNAEDSENILKNFQSTDTLILVENLHAHFTSVLSHYFDADLFYEKLIAADSSDMVNDLNCILKPTDKDCKTFTKGVDWDHIHVKKCAVVCGGKGVGKSTLLKYLINRLLTDAESVLCLDFDPGQTEFTPPGCVSAVLVKKPLLGPNFTHIADPEKMVYFGEVNVALNPTKFMESVHYIIQSCRRNPEFCEIPWIVNTMGFNKGIGVDIMVNVIMLLKPDVVIQIYSFDPTRNYPFQLSMQNISSKTPLFIEPEESSLEYEHYELNSCSRGKGIAFQSGFKPMELRELMTLSYFSQIVSFPYYSLNACQPVWVSFANVYLAVATAISPVDILKAFNGSLVGLCNLEEDMCEEIVEVEGQESNMLKIAIKPCTIPCFGLAIVRCIDLKEEKIYLLTHLPVDTLNNVNCLTLGQMNPPHSIYLRQFYVEGPTIYTNINRSRNVRSIKQEFKYVPPTETGQINHRE